MAKKPTPKKKAAAKAAPSSNKTNKATVFKTAKLHWLKLSKPEKE
jgi:hypothetical protein